MTNRKIIAILDPAQALIAADILEITSENFSPKQDTARAAVAREIRHAIAFASATTDHVTKTAARPDETLPTSDAAAKVRTDLENIDWTTVDDIDEVIDTMRHRHLLAPRSQLTPRQRDLLETFVRELTLTLWKDRHTNTGDVSPKTTQ